MGVVEPHRHVDITVVHAWRNFVSMVKVDILIMDPLFGWIGSPLKIIFYISISHFEDKRLRIVLHNQINELQRKKGNLK